MADVVVVLDRSFGEALSDLAKPTQAVWVIESDENRQACENVWRRNVVGPSVSVTCFDGGGYPDDLDLLRAFMPEVLDHHPMALTIAVIGYKHPGDLTKAFYELGCEFRGRELDTLDIHVIRREP